MGVLVGASFASAAGIGGDNQATRAIYYPGDPVTWELRVDNVDNGGPITVDLWDVLPNGVRVDLADDLVIPEGGSWTYTLSGRYNVAIADLFAGGGGAEYLENLLHIEGTNKDGDRLSGDLYDSARVIRPAVSISTTVDFDGDGVFGETESNLSGQIATWRVVVTNNGTADLQDLTLTDDNGYGYGAPFELAPGESREFTYTQAITAPVVMTASVIGYDNARGVVGPRSDPAGVTPQVPGIAVAKTVDFNGDGVFSESESAPSGSTATWRVVVTNSGTAALTGVVAQDGSGWTTVPFALVAGESRTFVHTTVVTATTVNIATVTGRDALQRSVGPSSDAATAVATFPDLGITKSSSVATAVADDVITYTLTYTNRGDAPAVGYTISDDFDERWADVTDAGGGAVSGGKITWTFSGALAPGAAASISYKLKAKTVTVLPTGLTNLDNTAVIATAGDTDPANDTAMARVVLDNRFLPFTPETPVSKKEPFLPFTGSESSLVVLAAGLMGIAGLVLRGRDWRGSGR